tara:strand:- start:18281 stop:19243 length:963 start_codon:yes stop_codon:yes gene_type:complete
MKKKIIIITGDPNSVNSEIIYKSWKKLKRNVKSRIYFISNFELLKKQFNKINIKVNLTKVNSINDIANSENLKILNVDLNFTNPFKVKISSASDYVISSLNLGHKLGLSKNVLGIINCAINKRLLKREKIGVTEFLAKKCNINDGSEVMLISNKNFSVSPITTHIDLKDVSKKINKNIIIKKVKTINKWFKNKYKRSPKIGILGLNPHNAELRNNSEEKKIIIPAIKRLKKFKIFLKGPLIADTIFIEDFSKFDVIVGMYHDQVLTPFKAKYKFNAINATLGIKYPRVSPDHGTAEKLIGKNKANPKSLIECINFIDSSR